MAKTANSERLTAAEVVKAAGGAKAVAIAFGINRQAVYQWVKADQIPESRVRGLAKLSRVAMCRIRPDAGLVGEAA